MLIKLTTALSCAKKIDRDPKVSESPHKIDSIHQNDSIVATRACAVATKIGCECQGKYFYICIGKLLVCHAGVNWKGETLTVNHSFSSFQLVPHATALSYTVLVVLSTFVLH